MYKNIKQILSHHISELRGAITNWRKIMKIQLMKTRLQILGLSTFEEVYFERVLYDEKSSLTRSEVQLMQPNYEGKTLFFPIYYF